jgi:hypothetical protein
MIDQHRLLTNPLAPAILADLGDNALANGAGERSALKSRSRFSASDALYIGHGKRLNGRQDRA